MEDLAAITDALCVREYALSSAALCTIARVSRAFAVMIQPILAARKRKIGMAVAATWRWAGIISNDAYHVKERTTLRIPQGQINRGMDLYGQACKAFGVMRYNGERILVCNIRVWVMAGAPLPTVDIAVMDGMELPIELEYVHTQEGYDVYDTHLPRYTRPIPTYSMCRVHIEGHMYTEWEFGLDTQRASIASVKAVSVETPDGQLILQYQRM